MVALLFGSGTVALIVMSTLMARLLNPAPRIWLCRIMVSVAILMAIQCNVVTDQFFYGSFNGEVVEFRGYGWLFWVEWIGWLAAFPLILFLVSRLSRLTAWLPALPILSFIALITPSLLSGQSAGSSFNSDGVAEFGYQARLEEMNYQQDFVPISYYVCGESADSCHVRSFGDLKPRGYFQHYDESRVYSMRLIMDLSLFRLVPMYLKEQLYNHGNWFIADTRLNGTSPWPDPVIREWTANLGLVEDRPVYKWYHYIGTHIPAKWDANCEMLAEPGLERSHYLAQAHCLLKGIAGLLDRLREAGIYEQTAVLISGDHGHNTVPDDLQGEHFNSAMSSGLLGSARPAFLAKPKGAQGPLKISMAPTSLMDIAPTALALAGIGTEEPSAFALSPEASRQRYFRPYAISEFFSESGTPFVEYGVRGPVHDAANWQVTGIAPIARPPEEFDPVNLATAEGFLLGARLGSGADGEAAWISGRQLAFAISIPGPPTSRNLELTLHIPDWMPSQTMTVSANGGAPLARIQMKPGPGFWQVIDVPLATEEQLEGQNFVSLLFDTVIAPPDVAGWKASAFIKSIRATESPLGE